MGKRLSQAYKDQRKFVRTIERLLDVYSEEPENNPEKTALKVELIVQTEKLLDTPRYEEADAS